MVRSATPQPWPDRQAHEVRSPNGRTALVPILAIGLAVYVALFLDTVVRSFIRAPYGDGFDILAVEFEAQDRHDPGGYLWRPHNGHHIVWLRLLTSLDVRLFGGQSTVFVVATLAAILAAAALTALQIWRGVEDKRLALVLAAVAPLAMLTTLNAFDVSVSINIPYVYAMTFAVAAFFVAETAPPRIWTVFVLLALAAGAAVGNSVGLASVPVLMVAVLRRPDRGRLWLLWVLGPILAAAFVLTAGRMTVEAASQAAPAGAAEQTVRMVRYFVSFCGLPWSATSDRMAMPGGLQPAAQILAPLGGLALVVAGLCFAAMPARGEGARRGLDRFCCSLILFSLAAAAAAVLGRIKATTGMQLPVRYSVLLAPLHIGILLLLAIRTPVLRKVRPRTLSAAVVAVLALGVAHQLAGRYVVLRYTDRINQIMAEYNAGRRTPEMPQYVYPDLRRADEVSAEMRRRGVYR